MRARVSLVEAARISGKSVATVRRRRDQLEQLGTTIGPTGWSIPVEALHQVFQIDSVTPTNPVAQGGDIEGVTALFERVAAAERAAAAAEQRAAVAEALAAERERHITSLTTSLRMLEAARPEVVEAPTPEPVKRRRWWSRD